MSAASAFRSLTSLNFMSFTLHRLKKRLAMLIAITTDWALFIGIVLILGLGSSWYMIERGSPLTTVTVGPWVSWISAGRPDADPYTHAYEARLGILPLNTDVSQTFLARIDSEGRDLVFSDVVVRVSEDFELRLHLDTDEANAAGVRQGDTCELVRSPPRRA